MSYDPKQSILLFFHLRATHKTPEINLNITGLKNPA